MKELDELGVLREVLDQISNIQKHYDEISRIKGENFNIFEILGVWSNETRLHSAFLAELLNPNGTHGLGDAFLKHFIEIISEEIEQLENGFYDTEGSSVQVEIDAGKIDKDYSKGGRIDIVISNNSKQGIIIENKIYAQDQQNQISRYNEYGKANFEGGYYILYLTLLGTPPNEKSTGGLKPSKDYFLISYSSTILKWLEICSKESTDQPVLRETIKQYATLLRRLTNQSYNKAMENEILEVMKSRIAECFLIANNTDKLKNKILIDFAEKVQEKIKGEAYAVRHSEPDQVLGQSNSYIVLENKKNWRFDLSLYFDGAYKPTIIIDIDPNDKSFDTEENRAKINERLNGIAKLKVIVRSNSFWHANFPDFLPDNGDAACWENLQKIEKVDELIAIFKEILFRIKDLGFLFKE